MRDFFASYFSYLLRLRGLIYGLAFMLYQGWAQPILLKRLLISKTSGQIDLWLGIGILILQVLDLAGFLLKWPMLKERVLRWPAESNPLKQGIYYLAFLVRIFMSAMLLVNGLQALGINFSKATGLPAFFAFVLFFLVIAKEGLIMAFLFEGFKPGPAVDLENLRVQVREILGEIILVIFAMISFSLTWDFLLLTTPPIEPNEKFFGALGAILMFLFLYPASRLAFVAEESLTMQTRANQIISTIFFLFTLVVCVLNVPGIR